MRFLRFFIEQMTQVYRISLYLLPKSFRREYGEELMRAFGALIEDASQQGGLLMALSVSLAAIGDVVRAAAREHWDERQLKSAKIRGAGQCTPRVEAALQLAHQEAVHASWCSDGHILLGLLREGGGIAAMVLEKLGIKADSLRNGALLTESNAQPPSRERPSDRRPDVLGLARVEASSLGHNFIGTEHVLLGLLGSGSRLPEATFQCIGLTLHEVRQAMLESLAELRPAKSTCVGNGFGRITAIATKLIVAAIFLLLLVAVAANAFGQSAADNSATNGATQTSPPNQDNGSAFQHTSQGQDVEIQLKEGRRLAAWLILPESTRPLPAIVMIPGYNPGHRNNSEEEFRGAGQEDSGTALARYLAKQGFAVLRLPIGGGANGNDPALSLSDLTDRVAECVEYLRSRPEIDSRRVGILGQSIGGFVAALAASRSTDLAFVVTLATPGESIDRTFIDVLDKLLVDNGAPAEERAALLRRMENTFTAAAKGASAEELRPEVEGFLRAEYRWLSKQQRQFVGQDADEFVARILDDHVKDLTSPMFRSLIGYDAIETLTKIQCPALMLFAGRDQKVDPVQNSAAAKIALEKTGRADGTVEVIADADHFFEASGRITEATEQGAEQRFSQKFLEVLTTWLLKSTSTEATAP